VAERGHRSPTDDRASRLAEAECDASLDGDRRRWGTIAACDAAPSIVNTGGHFDVLPKCDILVGSDRHWMAWE